MLRRLSILSVLLFSLAGVIPTALGCALMASEMAPGMAQEMGCCNADLSCDPAIVPSNVVAGSQSCCFMHPVIAPKVVAVKTDQRVDDSPFLDPLLSPSIGIPSTVRPSIGISSFAYAVPYLPDQQQIYLLTGRLRL